MSPTFARLRVKLGHIPGSIPNKGHRPIVEMGHNDFPIFTRPYGFITTKIFDDDVLIDDMD
jgi:hypothetical protein